MRFIEQILKQYPGEQMARMMTEAVKLRIQNVSDYWSRDFDKQHETVDLKRDFPLIVPPWPVMYAEWMHRFRDPEEVLTANCGVLALTERLADRDFAINFLIFRSQSRAAPPALRGNIDMIAIERAAESDGSPRNELVRSAVSSDFARRLKAAGQEAEADLVQQMLSRSGWEMLQPLLLAITFAHCKNVKIVDRVGNSTRVRKDRGTAMPDDRWRVLQIDPMRQLLKGDGREGSGDLQRAMHICRGHFKTYDEDHPLFGKILGTFWWSAHVRGNPAFGFVEKEYAVKAPAS
jgi:hypothetical protein